MFILYSDSIAALVLVFIYFIFHVVSCCFYVFLVLLFAAHVSGPTPRTSTVSSNLLLGSQTVESLGGVQGHWATGPLVHLSLDSLDSLDFESLSRLLRHTLQEE